MKGSAAITGKWKRVVFKQRLVPLQIKTLSPKCSREKGAHKVAVKMMTPGGLIHVT